MLYYYSITWYYDVLCIVQSIKYVLNIIYICVLNILYRVIFINLILGIGLNMLGKASKCHSA